MKAKKIEIDMEINELICNSYSYEELYNDLCFIIRKTAQDK